MQRMNLNVESLLSSVYAFMMTPRQTPVLMIKGPKSRTKTKYSDNVTAAITLPDTVKTKPKPCRNQTAVITANYSLTSSIFNSIYSLFSKPLPSIKQEQPENPQSTKQSKKSSGEVVDKKIIELVSEMKKAQEKNDNSVAESLLLEQINLVEYEIMEHAERRVDLYFYLLVAVYQQGALIEKKSTNKQHGSGTNARGTNACHDSLFPHVKLNFPKTTGNIAWSLLFSFPAIRGKHFEDSNNMTTELPSIVNDFDTYLELATPGRQSGPSKYLKKLLMDLNLVSQGQITPIDAMNRFFKVIKEFFNEFDEKHLKNKTFEFSDAMKRVWELQYTGTLRAQAEESDTIDMKYVCLLLRIPSHDIPKALKNPTSLLTYYCPIIQKEILNTPSVLIQSKGMGK